MSQASAPGKIILFGEHAVVYGQPALAVPVTQVQARVFVRAAARPGCRLLAPDVHLQADLETLPPDHPLRRAISLTLDALQQPPLQGVEIEITSTIPVASGLGSGAAVSVALIRALSAHLGQPLPAETVNALAYEVEKIHHGSPSGIDNTVVTYAQPVWFVRGQPVQRLSIRAPFTLVIGDTGIPAPTKEAVADVRRLWQFDPQRYERIFAAIGGLTRSARMVLRRCAPHQLGPLMNENHALLRELTVSSPELEALIAAAREAGALGAKLSGGGRGGNMIALATPQTAPQIAAALRAAGARQTLITTVR